MRPRRAEAMSRHWKDGIDGVLIFTDGDENLQEIAERFTTSRLLKK
jgi:hypothetical protein